VVFDSRANNLSNEDGDGTGDVFVRDLSGPPAAAGGQAGGAPSAGQPGPAPSVGPPAPARSAGRADIRGPAIRAGALARANRIVRVSRTGGLQLFCGRYAEPVSGVCAARSARSLHAPLARRRGRAPARTLRLAPKSFRAADGRRVVLRFRLSARDLASLTAAGPVRMRGTLIARDRLGNPTKVSFPFVLKGPRQAGRRS
jgi:hypothetical protein